MEMSDLLNGLRCRECGRGYPSAPLHVCEFCFGPLEVDYHYEAIERVVSRASIAAGPASMWRYRALLPIEGDVAVGHHTGFTPLVRARNLEAELGCREIWIKNDSVCSVVICITGNGLKTPDALAETLTADITITPSLAAFDRALADLKSQTA
jgi:threonine synthase